MLTSRAQIRGCTGVHGAPDVGEAPQTPEVAAALNAIVEAWSAHFARLDAQQAYDARIDSLADRLVDRAYAQSPGIHSTEDFLTALGVAAPVFDER